MDVADWSGDLVLEQLHCTLTLSLHAKTPAHCSKDSAVFDCRVWQYPKSKNVKRIGGGSEGGGSCK